MKPNFDFNVNRATHSVHVKREFAAGLDLVWSAWTTPELLDQWWAPKPYQTKTKSMDFREGGTWLYAMESPEGDMHWCKLDYEKIEPHKQYSGLDAFCDEQGNINPDFPRSHWTNTFSGNAETATVHVHIQYKTIEDLDKVIALGFKEGFGMALENLDQYIASKFKLQSELRQDNNACVCTYLNFPGNTEEAFLFYQSVFKTEFAGAGIQRFGDLPVDDSHPPVPDHIKQMVLHVELPLLGGHILKGTDAPKEMGFTLKTGNNMHISLAPENLQETQRLYAALSEGGTIEMPLQLMFFGAYYAGFTDKFGINWMLNFKEIN